MSPGDGCHLFESVCPCPVPNISRGPVSTCSGDSYHGSIIPSLNHITVLVLYHHNGIIIPTTWLYHDDDYHDTDIYGVTISSFTSTTWGFMLSTFTIAMNPWWYHDIIMRTPWWWLYVPVLWSIMITLRYHDQNVICKVVRCPL